MIDTEAQAAPEAAERPRFEPGVISSGELLSTLRISAATLSRWQEDLPGLRAAQLMRGWWSVPRLRAAGILTEPKETAPPAPREEPAALPAELRELAVRALAALAGVAP